MDKVSVTKTQANSNKILKTCESNKSSMFQAKLCFLERFCLVKSIKANGTYPLFYQRVQLV